MTKNEKISQALKEHFAKNGNPRRGVPGRKHTEEQKEHLRAIGLEAWSKRARVSDTHKKARNKANVYAWRARKYNAIIESSDLGLIREIYENCPIGHYVDHIQALDSGGLHHQDNLQYLPASENCRKGKDRAYDTSKVLPWKDFYSAIAL